MTALLDQILTAPYADPTPRGTIVPLPVRALFDTRLKPQHLSLLALLCYQANFAPNGVFLVSHQKLGEFFGLARTTALEYVRHLECCGYIASAGRTDCKGKTLARAYKVQFDPTLPDEHRRWSLDAGDLRPGSGASAALTPQIQEAGRAVGNRQTTTSGASPGSTPQNQYAGKAPREAQTTISGASARPTPQIYGVGATDTKLKDSPNITLESLEEEEEEEEEDVAPIDARELADLFLDRCTERFGSCQVRTDSAAELAAMTVPRGLARVIIDQVLDRLPEAPRSLRVVSRTWTVIATRWAGATARSWCDVEGLLDDHTANDRQLWHMLCALWPKPQDAARSWPAFQKASRRAGGADRIIREARAMLAATPQPYVQTLPKWLEGMRFDRSDAPPDQSYPVAPDVDSAAADLWRCVCRRNGSPMLKSVTLVAVRDNQFTAHCSSRMVFDWMNQRHHRLLEQALRSRSPDAVLKFTV